MKGLTQSDVFVNIIVHSEFYIDLYITNANLS